MAFHSPQGCLVRDSLEFVAFRIAAQLAASLGRSKTQSRA
jgi:hypothetical protein